MSAVTVVIGKSGRKVGRIWFGSNQSRQFTRFEYDEEWLNWVDRFMISPDLPLKPGGSFKSKRNSDGASSSLHGCFQDASPDSWGRQLLRYEMQNDNPAEFDYLTHVNDSTRTGAIRLIDEKGESLASNFPKLPSLSELEQLRSLVHDFEQGQIDERIRDLVGAMATGGTRPKANVLDGDSLWLVKFTSAKDTRAIERAEVATMQLAKMCGLRVPESKLELKKSDRPVALFKRFDRRGEERIPYVSARTALNNLNSEPSYYTALADLIRQISNHSQRELMELWQRMVFTILVTNTDDHLKNHGFIYAGNGKWNLSPLFDVNPSPERLRFLKTGIMEGHNFSASMELALEAAFYFDIQPTEAKKIASRMAKCIDENWQQTMRSCGASTSETNAFRQAFQHKEMEFALSLS